MHPGICADIFCEGQKIGQLGKLRYEIVNDLNIAEGKKTDLNVIIAELNYSALESLYKREMKFTADNGKVKAKRDISLICDKKTLCVEIEDVIKEASEKAVDVKLIDSFESEKLGLGKKSLTFTITYAGAEDITDEIADSETENAANALNDKLGAVRRV